MDVNIQNYEYLYELLKIAQNCSENTYTCQKKNLLKIAQNCLKVLIPAQKICSKLLQIAQTYLKGLISAPKKMLKNVQNGSKLLKIV